MPRYYFHMDPLGVRDAGGQDLDDDAAARREATSLAHELTRHGVVGPGARIIVTNEGGVVVHEEQVTTRLSPPTAAPAPPKAESAAPTTQSTFPNSRRTPRT